MILDMNASSLYRNFAPVFPLHFGWTETSAEGAAAVVLTVPGLEYSSRLNRLHFTTQVALFHYTTELNRLHYTTREED